MFLRLKTRTSLRRWTEHKEITNWGGGELARKTFVRAVGYYFSLKQTLNYHSGLQGATLSTLNGKQENNFFHNILLMRQGCPFLRLAGVAHAQEEVVFMPYLRGKGWTMAEGERTTGERREGQWSTTKKGTKRSCGNGGGTERE